jgi:pyruvate dehydrogenase E1 component alpha subunit
MRVEYSYRQVAPETLERTDQRDLPDDRALSIYRKMLLARQVETALAAAYSRVEFRGELHLSAGNEAVAAGVVAAAEPCFLAGTHRSHAVALAKGVDPTALMAEVYGRTTGLCRGKGGHMHLTDLARGFVTSGIVGASVPIAAGYALSAKQLGLGTIAVGFLGDGAMNQGGVLETLNLAPAWGLPLLLIVENNELAFSSRTSDLSKIRPLAARARGFGLEAFAADGTDATAVWALTSQVAEKVRSGSRPALIEFSIPRLSGHLEVVDFEDYLEEGEKQRKQGRDPLQRTRETLFRAGILSEATDAVLMADAQQEAEAALRAASSAPFPEPSDALTDAG